MQKLPKLKGVLPTEPDDRIRRLINLTARLVNKMLPLEQKTDGESQTDEQ